jgi:histidinol-phosphate/aromatic aminotransferase/cobyric acid decarboxylase-like protein
VLIDEAFMDWVPDEVGSLAGASLDGVLVVRSLTKLWGLAGLRIGYLLGSAELVRRCALAQPRWSVSAPALAAAVSCCGEAARAEAAKRISTAAQERVLLEAAVRHRGAQVVHGSVAPFVLAWHPGLPRLHSALRARGIAVRRADTFPGLGSGWVRISVRDAQARDRLTDSLDALLGATGTTTTATTATTTATARASAASAATTATARASAASAATTATARASATGGAKAAGNPRPRHEEQFGVIG